MNADCFESFFGEPAHDVVSSNACYMPGMRHLGKYDNNLLNIILNNMVEQTFSMHLTPLSSYHLLVAYKQRCVDLLGITCRRTSGREGQDGQDRESSNQFGVRPGWRIS